MFLFDPPENIRKQKVFWCFQGDQKGTSGRKSLNIYNEVRRKAFDTGDHAGALLTDFSKTFNCIDHELLLVKLNFYGLHSRFLYFLSSYLDNRKQRTKVDSSHSDFQEIPQGSLLGALLLKIYTCDLFYDIEDIDMASYADDKTPYTLFRARCCLEKTYKLHS